jgi:nucleoside 2-deoxyribosyltransferase
MGKEKVKIYLAGCEGYYINNFPDYKYYLDWRQEADFWLNNNSNDNVTIINPCDYYDYKANYHKSEAEVRRFLLNKVRHSDIVLVNLDHIKDSAGTMNEIFVANELNIPVIGFYEFSNKDTFLCDNRYLEEPWIMDACHRIEDSESTALLDAMIYIRDYYLF